MRYALKFGYSGKKFFGYAQQPKLRTIESEIIKALTNSKIITDEKNTELKVASRTDKGVSAVGNVLALKTDFRKKEIIPALNAHLDEIWFYALTEVSEDFNPRHAQHRWYRYYLFDEEFDISDIKDITSIFIGTHDFSNFARLEGKDPIRTIDSIEVGKEKDFIILDFRAQSFLWHMVRRIVKAISGTINGKLSPEDIKEALDSKQKIDFGMAEPEPLILMDVKYDFDFIVDLESYDKIKMNLQKRIKDLKMEGMIYHLIQKIDK